MDWVLQIWTCCGDGTAVFNRIGAAVTGREIELHAIIATSWQVVDGADLKGELTVNQPRNRSAYVCGRMRLTPHYCLRYELLSYARVSFGMALARRCSSSSGQRADYARDSGLMWAL